MATVGEQLLYGYTAAHGENPSLTRGQYMRRVFPNRYATDKDAADAYGRVVSGKRSGRFLAKDIEVRHTRIVRGQPVPLGGYQEGLWQMRVYFISYKDGVATERVMSKNLESIEHVNYTSLPFIEEKTLALADELMDEWCQSFESCELQYIEILPISSFQKDPIDIDGLVIER